MRRNSCLAAALVLVLLSGCTSIGPRTVNRDRFDYTTAVADSWKSQMLLNIVKLRYSDPPVFLDVPSMISQYSLQASASVSAGWSTGVQLGDNQTVGAEGAYSERPTITYTPLSADRFVKSLLTPISPAALLFLVQSGWPIDLLFEVCVKSVNSIDNRSTVPVLAHRSDPEFQRLLELMAQLQPTGAVSIQIPKKNDGESATIVFRRHADPKILSILSEFKRLLGVNPDAQEIRIVHGANVTGGDEIAILTRSIMDVMMEMSSQIDVPNEHVSEGRTYGRLPEIGSGAGQMRPFTRVYTDRRKPDFAFAAIRNRGQWFWIDDRDRASKAPFMFLMLLLSLAEKGAPPQTPLVTVPAG